MDLGRGRCALTRIQTLIQACFKTGNIREVGPNFLIDIALKQILVSSINT